MAGPVLVADIGGTNARFAIAETGQGGIAVRDARAFRAEDFKTVRDAAAAYLASVSDRPARGCFAAAGPLIDGAVDFTNSPWTLRADDIADPLGLSEFLIVNDFYALAAGLAHLGDDAFVTVKEGRAVAGAPQLVIGPGTGFGQALIAPTKTGRKVIATEGGHVAFAAQTDEEIAVRNFIAWEHPRVTVERVLSGPGLVNIYRALSAIADAPGTDLDAGAITAAAASGADPLAVKTVALFCDILGRVAGDGVLATGARGGVVLGGGVLPKMRNILMASAFAERFVEKGRMTAYVRAVPVTMIVKGGAALYGAAAALEERP